MSDQALHIGRYLVCVDKTSESRVALKLACIKAKCTGGVVDIIHIIPPGDFQTLAGIADRMREEQRQEAETLLTEIAREAQEVSGVLPSLIIREGQVGSEILAAALEDHDATMLVVGVGPVSASRGTLINWLSAQLGTGLLIPLMLVPGNLTDQQLQALV